MGIVAVTSAANHDRILFGQEWLKTKGPAEEVLIIGSTLAATNEIARSLIREKRAAFGYHRLSWGQFASTLARPLLAAQRTVLLGGLGVQAVANGAIHKLSQVDWAVTQTTTGEAQPSNKVRGRFARAFLSPGAWPTGAFLTAIASIAPAAWRC
jgi:hypothetical protein